MFLPPACVIFSLRLARSMFRRGYLARFLLVAAVLVLNGAVVVSRRLTRNGTVTGDSGPKNARLPPLDVRTPKRVLAAIGPALKSTEQRGLRCRVTLPETTAH